MDEEKEPKGIKIVDRRRFDATGNDRDEPGEKASPKPAPQPVASQAEISPRADAAVAESFGGEDEPINFSSFVMSLATQTLMQLGEMKPPPGLEINVDREAARQTIDILRMLQRKTAGNLDASEAKLLEEILHTLMMSYVKVTS